MVASSERLSRANLVHTRLVYTRQQRGVLDHETTALLRQIDDERLFEAFGYASIFQYADKEHGINRRVTADLLRVAHRLDCLPALATAFAAGELDKCKVRDIVRVATPSTEQAWVDRAKITSSRDLEALLRAVGPDGMPPDALPEPPLKPEITRLAFDLRSTDAEVVRQTISLLRAQCGAGSRDVSDGVLLAIMARFVASHAEMEHVPSGVEPYRVVLTQTEGGARCCDHAVDESIVEEACCDTVITDVTPGPRQGHSRRSIPPAARMITLAEHDFRCAVVGCDHRLFLDVHHLQGRDVADPHNPRNLVALCPVHHRITHDGYLGVERKPDGDLQFSYRFGGRVVHVRRSAKPGAPRPLRVVKYPGLAPMLAEAVAAT